MAKLEPYRGDYYLWNYIPSIAAAVIFIILFILTTALHTWRMFKTKSWFCTAFCVGGLFETIGYIGRAMAVNSTGKLLPYVIQSFFTLVAPAFMAASIYMTLGRIMRYVHGEHHSIIRINWLTKIFVIADLLSFFVQAGSSGLMFNDSTASLGQKIVLVGLFVQIIAFGFFLFTALVFERRIRKEPTPESFVVEANWIHHLHCLYAMSVLILIRSVFRVVEYAAGQKGYPLMHEWTVYTYDTVPMWIVTVIFFIWYPSQFQVKPGTRTSPGETGEEAQSVQLMNSAEKKRGSNARTRAYGPRSMA
ncbi:putative rta1 domain protein [Botrytis fragariae]|uniref:Putative rta1 domain protein n=1 Tax=Botrytis fragariae TaxID=1964551 RepID=A0A8H6EMV4_9HELO|nr:putative rta1 domain protein [Botrytis fragariae]KAF5878058.1 putative rta1 domain protein [Botrytis fragariae]